MVYIIHRMRIERKTKLTSSICPLPSFPSQIMSFLREPIISPATKKTYSDSSFLFKSGGYRNGLANWTIIFFRAFVRLIGPTRNGRSFHLYFRLKIPGKTVLRIERDLTP